MHIDSSHNKYRDAKVLITGGCGFIGSGLARKLVGLGARVTICDSLIPQYGGNLFNIRDITDSVKLNISDVRDPHSFRYLIQGQDYIFNLAGQTSHLDSMADPFTDLEINCVAQLHILESCRKYAPEAKLVFASTRQLYGRPRRLPVDEDHILQPVDVNGVNKMAGEAFHILYSQVYGIRCCALRLTNVYGPGMRVKDARQTFLGIWIRNLLEEKPIEVWGGFQRRDYSYVDDTVDAFLCAGASSLTDGHVYNVGGGEVITLAETAQLMLRVLGRGRIVTRDFPEDRAKIDIGDYFSDDSLFRGTVHWRPTVSLDTGVRETLCFYQRNLSHYI